MSLYGPIVVRKTIATSRQRVWQLICDENERESWWPETEIEPEIGGNISTKFSGTDKNAASEAEAQGTIDVFVEDQTLGYSWQNKLEDITTSVVILLRPADENMDHTVITVIESGFAGHDNAEHLISAAQERWSVLFEALADTAVDFSESNTQEGDSVSVESDAVSEDQIEHSADEVENIQVSDAAASEAEETAILTETDATGEEVPTDTDEGVSEFFEENTEENPVFNELEDDLADDIDDIDFHEAESDGLSDDTVSVSDSETVILDIIEEEAILIPEPIDDLGENDHTGEVHITVVDGEGVALEAEDIDAEGVSDWEKLLKGEDLD